MGIAKILSVVLLGLLSYQIQAADFKPLKGQTAVRVCADAHNLPYSNKKLEGFDNRIAAIIGEELGIPVEYYWFPQRIGFTRNTIKKVDPETGRFLCDMAMSMPASPGRLAVTTPYFESIDALVYRDGEGYEIDQISDIADARNKAGEKLKIGLFDRALATERLLELGLDEQIEYFQFMAGDARVYPGRIVEDALASGQIDVAFTWGPIGGYFASKSDVAMTVVPLNELGDRFIFDFALGVRHQDKGWKALLNQILEKRQDDIAAIVAEYNFPSLDGVVSSAIKEPVYRVEDGQVDGKTYVGWRLFNSTCHVCHGKHATGTTFAPNLLKRVESMSEKEFRTKLLSRYFEKVNLDDPNMRLAFLEQVVERDRAEFKMPIWADDPNIRPHISHLYSYLKARSDGALGEERPTRFEK